MNIPGVKNAWLRRLNLIWIIPYLVIAAPCCIIYEGCREILPCVPSTLADVWRGR